MVQVIQSVTILTIKPLNPVWLPMLATLVKNLVLQVNLMAHHKTKAEPKFRTWMLQTEATLMKFCAKSTSFLYKMANIHTAFNVCGYLTFCDETLVSIGHRISVINKYASVHNTPMIRSSSDSSLSKLQSGKRGKVPLNPPGTSKKTQLRTLQKQQNNYTL